MDLAGVLGKRIENECLDAHRRGYAEGLEAGQRAERERIVRQFEAISQSDDGTCYADYSDAIDAFIDKLRADPAESGE